MDRSAGNDRENETFLAILLSPIPRAAIFIGKSIANGLFALTIGAILIGLMTFLYNLPLLQPMIFLHPCVVGGWACQRGNLACHHDRPNS
ncbi:MAG UNVERIFIED_CONTAM: hypothetical protein LVT10_17040 [Anaerolineae bacterium]|jgi:ABC-type Na+ efflux pump permease subunit